LIKKSITFSMANWSAEHIQMIKSLFKGRKDVFALRWEKEGKSGYMPAYEIDWYAYERHKIKGGTFHNFPNKKLLPLSDEQIIKHLNGEHFIGIYPLLEDNTSFIIAADFDKENWVEACRKLISCCQDVGLPAYLERSRSGEGGHVWLFFDAPYSAYKSRKVFTHLLEEAGIVSAFDKNASFDRLFPNQDYLSGKGFGNLIALPFHQEALAQGNSCFIHPETLLPYSDPWSFLSTIEKVSTAQLDTIFASLQEHKGGHIPESLPTSNSKLCIRLDNKVFIHKNYMPAELIKFLKDELNFVSSQYQLKRKQKKNAWGTEKYFSSIEETEQEVVIPRGFIGRLLRFCRKKQIEYEFTDQREKLPAVQFRSHFSLRDYQNIALEATDKKDYGIIVAPPGSGKTIMGLAIIAQKCQPALIVVHRKQLYDQWVERIESFLGIPKHEIGKIAQGQVKISANITVAMMQSLSKALANRSISSQFGLILMDECHHVPAKSFRETISQLSTYYLYGLTATPFRKHNDEKLLFVHLGDKIAEIKPDLPEVRKEVQIIIRETSLDIPFDSKTDTPEVLYKMLIHDGLRNRLILQDIEREVTAGKKLVVLTERKEHIDSLNQYLKQSYETITLSGDDAATVRKSKWQQLQAGHFQVLITTGQLFGEGTDLHNIDCLILAYPFAFEGKLVQYIGRVQRSEFTPVIYDYRDRKIAYLEKQFKKRNRHYQNLRKQGLLKEHEELILTFDADKAYLNPEDEFLSLDDLGLPEWITALQAGTCWRIRVIHFHEESGTLLADVLNYAAQEEETEMFQQQHSFLFYNIERIDFRSLNTSRILPSVIRRDLSKVRTEKSTLENHFNQQATYTIEKTIHLPWEKIIFYLLP
jgi:superfamily II DNA or RNA helicase